MSGAVSGVGAKIERVFQAEGVRLVVNDLNAKALDALASELGGDTHVCPATSRMARTWCNSRHLPNRFRAARSRSS